MDDKKLDGMSYDTVHERIEELKRMFPEAVHEGRLDYDMFMALLGDEFDNDSEKYQFTWKGKLDSLKLAQKRSGGTLRPDYDGSRDWDTTSNLYIEGDNLEVLKLLQQGYLRKVKMIYIDPPYNTGNDFVYEDDFADPIAKYKEATGQGLRANPETAGRYHSNWLNMMYPRLKIAKTLLRDDGVIFISIDDTEQANLRKLCDEVFGEENFIASCIWQKRTSPDARKVLSEGHEYLVMYGRNLTHISEAISVLPLSESDKAAYKNPDDDPRGPWVSSDFTAQGFRPNQMYTITTPGGKTFTPPDGTCWKNVEEVYQQQVDEGRFWFGKDGNGMPRRKTYLFEKEGRNLWTWWPNAEVGHTQEATQEHKTLFIAI